MKSECYKSLGPTPFGELVLSNRVVLNPERKIDEPEISHYPHLVRVEESNGVLRVDYGNRVSQPAL